MRVGIDALSENSVPCSYCFVENNVHRSLICIYGINIPSISILYFQKNTIIVGLRNSFDKGRKWRFDCELTTVVEFQKAAVPHIKSSSLPKLDGGCRIIAFPLTHRHQLHNSSCPLWSLYPCLPPEWLYSSLLLFFYLPCRLLFLPSSFHSTM